LTALADYQARTVCEFDHHFFVWITGHRLNNAPGDAVDAVRFSTV